jgi:formate dehydrogenase maturation protein FdhE
MLRTRLRQQHEKLRQCRPIPVCVVDQLPHARVKACETCLFFIRTIDLTKVGHAVRVVDDLAATPLTFWAHEYGYSRLPTNLLGS